MTPFCALRVFVFAFASSLKFLKSSRGELFDFLAFTGSFEEAIARTYFQQLIAGIAHCHSKGIVHGDDPSISSTAT